MNIPFTNSRTVSIKSKPFGHYLGCKRSTKREGVLGRYVTGYRYEVKTYLNVGSDETYWDVVDIDGNYIALKNHWGTHLSVQPGIL